LKAKQSFDFHFRENKEEKEVRAGETGAHAKRSFPSYARSVELSVNESGSEATIVMARRTLRSPIMASETAKRLTVH
jgi:hypothetical protein